MNLDPGHGEGPWRRFAQEVPWPIEDGTVEEIHASHMMEHVPAGADRIAVMNEAWRVLRPGGTFEIRVPMFPGWQAIADPTHVSYWVPQSFYYFTGDIGPDADYGIKYWTADYVTVIDGWELRALMRKPEAA
jgi:SAM-dependent methyltransferase